MYEGMKPKDAAKVFDRLEMPVLFEIASQIAPRKMADILGQMSPEVAERLTVEMARRAGSRQVQLGGRTSENRRQDGSTAEGELADMFNRVLKPRILDSREDTPSGEPTAIG